ncbi:hypothetical protein H4Q26_012930 [Puccinia striiformis f. sp. tritici PST-130]|nr:hypothetical protein H4Q26_012930 [Puccinia striiformis f. sp. tritici PST-130]
MVGPISANIKEDHLKILLGVEQATHIQPIAKLVQAAELFQPLMFSGTLCPWAGTHLTPEYNRYLIAGKGIWLADQQALTSGQAYSNLNVSQDKGDARPSSTQKNYSAIQKPVRAYLDGRLAEFNAEVKRRESSGLTLKSVTRSGPIHTANREDDGLDDLGNEELSGLMGDLGIHADLEHLHHLQGMATGITMKFEA